jgi:hypothetical protein
MRLDIFWNRSANRFGYPYLALQITGSQKLQHHPGISAWIRDPNDISCGLVIYKWWSCQMCQLAARLIQERDPM